MKSLFFRFITREEFLYGQAKEVMKNAQAILFTLLIPLLGLGRIFVCLGFCRIPNIRKNIKYACMEIRENLNDREGETDSTNVDKSFTWTKRGV